MRFLLYEIRLSAAIQIEPADASRSAPKWVRGVAVTADDRHAISASLDRTLKVWDLSTGQIIVTLETNTPLLCCAVTPDGRIILAGDSVGAVHILDWVHP